MIRRLAFALLVPLPLLAQVPDSTARPGPEGPARTGLTFAVTGFTGGVWQPSGLEVGLLRATGNTPSTWVAASVRVGSFVQDQAVYIGRTTGFFIAAAGSARTSLATLATVGSERAPSLVRLIGMVEAGGSVNFNSPLPQGSTHLFAAALAGFAFSSGTGRVEDSFAVLLGPAGFFGKATNWHMQAALRYQTPLRR